MLRDISRSAASLLVIGLYLVLLGLERRLVFWQRPS